LYHFNEGTLEVCIFIAENIVVLKGILWICWIRLNWIAVIWIVLGSLVIFSCFLLNHIFVELCLLGMILSYHDFHCWCFVFEDICKYGLFCFKLIWRCLNVCGLCRCQVLCGSCNKLPRTSLQYCYIFLVIRDHWCQHY
jgi:hypothetical protein